jgi:hypothetical protein
MSSPKSYSFTYLKTLFIKKIQHFYSLYFQSYAMFIFQFFLDEGNKLEIVNEKL